MFTRFSSVKKFNLKNFSKVNKCIVDNPYTLEVIIYNLDFYGITLC